MITILKLKRDSVVVVKTVNVLQEDKAEMLLSDLKKAFPNNEVVLPNGAEIIILEQE